MPNAKVLESKKAIVDELTGKIQGASAVVFVDYKGINVAQDTDLRKQFRDASVDYSVVKNTLTRFAANKAGYSQSTSFSTARLPWPAPPATPSRPPYRLRVCQEEQERPVHQGRSGGRLRPDPPSS